jgi:hypothetical protein
MRCGFREGIQRDCLAAASLTFPGYWDDLPRYKGRCQGSLTPRRHAQRGLDSPRPRLCSAIRGTLFLSSLPSPPRQDVLGSGHLRFLDLLEHGSDFLFGPCFAIQRCTEGIHQDHLHPDEFGENVHLYVVFCVCFLRAQEHVPGPFAEVFSVGLGPLHKCLFFRSRESRSDALGRASRPLA